MANQQSKKVYTKIQNVYDRPRRVLIGTYTTKSGEVKNRYFIDSEAKIIKTITHPINHRRVK